MSQSVENRYKVSPRTVRAAQREFWTFMSIQFFIAAGIAFLIGIWELIRNGPGAVGAFADIGIYITEFMEEIGEDGWIVMTALAAVVVAFTVVTRSGESGVRLDAREFTASWLLQGFLLLLAVAVILTAAQIVLSNWSNGFGLSSAAAVLVALSLSALSVESRMMLATKATPLEGHREMNRKLEFLRWRRAVDWMEFPARPRVTGGRSWLQKLGISIIWVASIVGISILSAICVEGNVYPILYIVSVSVMIGVIGGQSLLVALAGLTIATVSRKKDNQVFWTVLLLGIFVVSWIVASAGVVEKSMVIGAGLWTVLVFFLDWFWAGPIYEWSITHCRLQLESCEGSAGRSRRRILPERNLPGELPEIVLYLELRDASLKCGLVTPVSAPRGLTSTAQQC